MNGYEGISADTLFLLAQNRFENNRDFYEKNKEKIKAGVIAPMRQIAECLLDDMYEYDSRMILNPTKMTSRIRRDTRFSKDKLLYRENVWIMFMRDKKQNPMIPAFWFEVYPDRYSCGVGTFYTDAKFMSLYREKILNETDRFEEAIKCCEKVGAVFHAESYKKGKEGNVPERLEKYYNVKRFYFLCEYDDMRNLNNDELIDELRKNYKAFNKMYAFLLEVSERYVSLKGAENNA